ncbi:hypothetical protein L596_019747 [Steinernema carpocapsae]|uniref:G-protein coupled receptors family 1 profile domain-containing protein n=1 Tax=Steinernema carpocapsae TaxID=34508 RepID=A0A4U5MSA9_STECR|nr:hypothetical protein L596_019747 [Steinernema carpocapsae]
MFSMLPYLYVFLYASLTRRLKQTARLAPAVLSNTDLPTRLHSAVMELMLFRRDEYKRLYNCSYLTDEEWFQLGHPNPTLGLFYITVGIFFAIPYIPCLIVVVKSRLCNLPGYKIMLYIGITDLLCLIVSGVFTGSFIVTGALACPYIDFQYILGIMLLALWVSQSMSVVLLAFQRCVEVWKPKYLYNSFKGAKTYFWLLGCVLYSVAFVIWSPGMLFSSTRYAWFHDPYVNLPGFEFIDHKQYENDKHASHNIFILITLPTLYTILCFSIWWKNRKAGSKTPSMQARITLQAFFLCVFTMLSAFIGVYMQFLPSLPTPLSFGVYVIWQCSNGLPACLYLKVNKQIRNGFINLLLGNKINKQMTTVMPANGENPPNSGDDWSY